MFDWYIKRANSILHFMPKLTPIESEFATTEEAAAYDTWLRSEIEASLADPRPGVPHEIVMAEMQAIIDRRKKRPDQA